MIRTVLTASQCPAGPGSPYRLAPEVLLVMVEDGSARIVDLDGAVAALDATATTMMKAALRFGEAGAVAELTGAFGVEPRRITTDLHAVLGDLAARGMIRSDACGLPRRARRSRRRVASALSALAVRRAGAGGTREIQAWSALTAAYLSLRLAGWSGTLGAWCTPGHPGWGNARQAAGNRNNSMADLDAIAVAVTRALDRHPFPLDCKERALAAFALARTAGLPARIVLGISLFPLALHAWCESGGQVVADELDGYCDRYTPLRIYG